MHSPPRGVTSRRCVLLPNYFRHLLELAKCSISILRLPNWTGYAMSLRFIFNGCNDIVYSFFIHAVIKNKTWRGVSHFVACCWHGECDYAVHAADKCGDAASCQITLYTNLLILAKYRLLPLNVIGLDCIRLCFILGGAAGTNSFPRFATNSATISEVQPAEVKWLVRRRFARWRYNHELFCCFACYGRCSCSLTWRNFVLNPCR